jgi:hypothetical protein
LLKQSYRLTHKEHFILLFWKGSLQSCRALSQSNMIPHELH